MEINLDEDEIRRLQEVYGRDVSERLRLGATPTAVVTKYPALILAILVGHAALGYERHRYWDEFFARLELPRDQTFEQTLRRQLPRLLSRFGLQNFPELKSEYVQLIALHAGFPVYCMSDVIDVLEERLAAGMQVTGASIIEWLDEPGKKHRIARLDVPVRNFLHYGGQLAIDILDRIIDFVSFTVENSSWAENDATLDTSTTGLPTLMLEKLIELLKERPIGTARARSSAVVRRRRAVAIRYQPIDQQVVVDVPYPDTDAGIAWRLSFDGDTVESLAKPGWGVRQGEEHPPSEVAVPVPTREIVMVHPSEQAPIRLAVVDKDDPLLLFDPSGQVISRRTAIPRGVVIALYPADAAVVDVATGGSVEPESGTTSSPVGWSGWVAAELDLANVSSIVLRREGTETRVRARTVQRPSSPTFKHGEPVRGLTTLNGLTVYGSAPSVTLPADPGRATNWRIRMRRSGSTDWTVDTSVNGSADGVVVDPFQYAPDDLLGLYEIQVSGSVGADLRQQVFVALGVSVTFSAPFRVPGAGGLEPVDAIIACDSAVVPSTRRLAFTPDDRDQVVAFIHGGQSYRLRLTPPYLQMRVDLTGTPAQWRSVADVLTIDELDENRLVALQAPNVAAALFILEATSGETLKEVVPSTPHHEYFEAWSRAFVDAARSAKQSRILALIDDEFGQSYEIVIAHIRPAALCSGAVVVDGSLVLEDPADEESLAVSIWARTAPWLPALTLEVADGAANLPDHLVNAGPLLLQVYVDDPWVTVTPPAWPDDSAIEAVQGGWVHDDNQARHSLSRFLAGEGPVPVDAVSMPEVSTALALLPQDSHDVHVQQLRSALGRILRENPRAALEALGSSTIPQPAMLELYIRSGLVYRSYAAEFALNDLHTNPWVGCLVEIADLPSLYRRRTEVAEERAETLNYLADKGGSALVETLRFGKSSGLYTAVFDSDTIRLDAMPAGVVQDIVKRARLVPGAVLDVDTRVAAVVEAFLRRRDWLQQGWSPQVGAATLRTFDAIKRIRGQIYREVLFRHEKLDGVDTTTHPWMLLSLQSLAFAVLARMEAHGMISYSPQTSDYDEAWATMARLCPTLVVTDLLIAEAMVTHARHGDLIGEDL